MKKLIVAIAFAMFGTITVSAQTTPQKTTTDTVKPDTTRNRDMRNDNNLNNGTNGTLNNGTNGTLNNGTNNNWDKSKTDTASWKNRDATTGDRKMKKKNK
jgi:hypothetical protein